MNQLLRLQKREEDEKRKEQNERATQLLIRLNCAILRYKRTFEAYLVMDKDGMITPKKHIIKADKKELTNCATYLRKQNYKIPDPTFSLFPTKEFIKEIETAEQSIGLHFQPSIQISEFFIRAGFMFVESRRLPHPEQVDTTKTESPDPKHNQPSNSS